MSIRIDPNYLMTNACALHQTLKAAMDKKQVTKDILSKAQTKLNELLQLVDFAHYRVNLTKAQTIAFMGNLNASVKIIQKVSNQEFSHQLRKIITLAAKQDHPEISSLVNRVEQLIGDFKYASEENIANARQFQNSLIEFDPDISNFGNKDKPASGQMKEDELICLEEQLSNLEQRYANPNFFKYTVPEEDFTMLLENYKALKILSFQFEEANERISSLLEESELMLGVIITAQEQLELKGTQAGGMLNPQFTELKNTTEIILGMYLNNKVTNIDKVLNQSDNLYRKLSQSEKENLLDAFSIVLMQNGIIDGKLPIKTTKSTFRFWGMTMQGKVKWEHRLCALENILASAPAAIPIVAKLLTPEMKRRLQEINEMTPPAANSQPNGPNAIEQSEDQKANGEENIENFMQVNDLQPLQTILPDLTAQGNVEQLKSANKTRALLKKLNTQCFFQDDYKMMGISDRVRFHIDFICRTLLDSKVHNTLKTLIRF